jgi:hypothetical protein
MSATGIAQAHPCYRMAPFYSYMAASVGARRWWRMHLASPLRPVGAHQVVTAGAHLWVQFGGMRVWHQQKLVQFVTPCLNIVSVLRTLTKWDLLVLS